MRNDKMLIAALLLLMIACRHRAQKAAWRQATDAELASLLPARAPVEKEHIETEMRTASGIVDSHGRFIAGVVLITAGYSADGKYSHYLVVQAPIRIGGIALKPGEYVFGWVARQRATPERSLQRGGDGRPGGKRKRTGSPARRAWRACTSGRRAIRR